MGGEVRAYFTPRPPNLPYRYKFSYVMTLVIFYVQISPNLPNSYELLLIRCNVDRAHTAVMRIMGFGDLGISHYSYVILITNMMVVFPIVGRVAAY